MYSKDRMGQIHWSSWVHSWSGQCLCQGVYRFWEWDFLYNLATKILYLCRGLRSVIFRPHHSQRNHHIRGWRGRCQIFPRCWACGFCGTWIRSDQVVLSSTADRIRIGVCRCIFRFRSWFQLRLFHLSIHRSKGRMRGKNLLRNFCGCWLNCQLF